MKTLLKITQQDILPDSPAIDTTNFRKREASRAVLLSPEGKVYLLNVSVHGYHKLPGGGIDEGETKIQALKRELLEEVGCGAKVIAELGQIIEYRNFEDGGLKQTSFCYLAKQIGDQGDSALEEGELAEGMIEIKATNIDEAIALLERDKPDNLEGKFIQKRDITILREAKKVIRETA